MKIYYNHNEEHPVFYFMTRRDNGLFCFSLKAPDMSTLQLGPCWAGNEDKIFEEATQIPEHFNRQFNLIYKEKNNYDGISRILRETFDIDQKIIDTAYDRDLDRADFIKDVMSEIKDSYCRNESYCFKRLYEKAKYYLRIWNGDKERAKKYMREHDIPEFRSYDNTLVDVFGECHPTKRYLLHEFHDSWGDRLNKIIDEAVEQYPDENDFDLAYYYTRDKLRDRDYGYE